MKTVSPVNTRSDITHGAAVRVMHVRCRAFCCLVLTGIAISAPDVLPGIDPWYSVIKGLGDTRWLHYSLDSAPAVLVLLNVLWGLVAAAFTVGWGALEPVVVEAPVIELPQLVALTWAADAPPRDD